VRLLLDTHVVLWQLEGSRALSPAATEAIAQATDLLFSVVSFAEIGVQAAIGKLSVPRDLREHVLHSGVHILRLDADHGLSVADLPVHHRDPFDRLLVAQARSERLTMVTADRRLAAYDVPVIDAG
jgi:PIN domain nuclease of toxin-antitoxin system